MKILRRVNSKMLVLLTTLMLAVLTLFAGVNVSQAPKASADVAGMTYIDTEVASINYFQSGKVILAFCLTESDYDDFDPVKDFNSEAPDFGEGTAKYNYITSLSYWNNFKNMNSEGVSFSQTFAYWNGGFGDSQIGSVGKNAVAHLTNLSRVEYGFMLQIPAGTEFPSWEYTQTKCTSEPKVYRTKTDVAFYFNGLEFEKIDYKVASQRSEAMAEIKNVNKSLYYAAEQALIADLVKVTTDNLNRCITLNDVDEALAEFNAALKNIKTIEDYAQLAAEKLVVKEEMAAFFNTLSESAYGEAEWALISSIKAETNTLIDEAETMAQVAEKVAGIRYKVEEILTEEEKPAFAQFVATAVKSVEDAFVASLYREAEAAQGAALVAKGKAALEKATTYAEAVALELDYLAQIKALKTDAEWTAEEEANKVEEPTQPSQPDEPVEEPVEEPAEDQAPTTSETPAATEKKGCSGSVMSTLVVISMALAFTLVVILKNKKRMDI